MLAEVKLAIAEDDCHLVICDIREAKSINFNLEDLNRNLIPDDFISSDIDKKDFVCTLKGLYVPDIEEIDFGECTCRGYIKVDDDVNLSSLVNKII